MIIDVIFLILVVVGFFKGMRQGLVVAVFSFLALIIGIAAAMKLSFIVSDWLASATNIGSRWLPVISFAIVIFAVGLLVRWLALIIKRSLRIAMLGWADRLGGVLFYILLYTLLFSVVLFYLSQMQIIKPGTIKDSYTYNIIQPLGPKTIALLSYVVPYFKDIFTQLESFFESLGNNYS